MWVIQGELLIRLPDGSPLPPGSIEVEPPPEFESDPGNFVVRDGKLEKVQHKKTKSRLVLTQDEIGRIKKAIAKGVI